MGTSGSTCAETPLRPPYRNRHLADALDPRSPSAGILRTPIEVLSQPSPGPGEAEGEEAEGPAATTAAPVRAGGLSTPRPRDPRSPTPGVVRTPFAFSVTVAKLSRLARQLSGVFLSEDEAEGDAVPGGRDAEDPHEAEELVGQLLDCEDEGDGDGGETPTAREGSSPPQEPDPPPVRTGTGLSGEACRVWRASPTPAAPTLSKRKPALLNVQSPGTVRPPLQPLAGGNSPQLALAHRQVSKLQSERLQDAEVLKAGGPSRIIYQDKENTYCLLGRLCPP